MLIAVALAGIVHFSPVFAESLTSPNSLTTVDAGDIQRFEQNYEQWVQSLAQSIVPNIPTTVLVDIEYSNNPDDLQNYEELKAANHLPGLPDVIDPNFTYPGESPISALVAKQRIKLIFESPLNANQQKLLKEVLNSKLKLNLDRGDSLALEQVNTLPSENLSATNSTSTATATTLPKIKLTHRQSLALVILALMTMIALTGGKAIRKSLSKMSTSLRSLAKRANAANETVMEYLRVVPSEKSVTQRLKRRHPRLFARTSMIVNPLNIVLKANPKVLVSVVRNEKIENLARATLHAPEMFTGILLNICTQDQRREIRGIWHVEKNAITEEQSRFAQVLLAARIYRQLKKRAQAQASDAGLDPIIGAFADAQRARIAQRSRLTAELKALKGALAQKSANPSFTSTSTQNEARL